MIMILAQVWPIRTVVKPALNFTSSPHKLIGAGFYLDATNPKYALHYNMRTHIQFEIPQVLEISGLPIVKLSFVPLAPLADPAVQDLTRISIFGHSMGGHGALTTYLASRAKQYRSASAFAPISNPVNAPWGQKAFTGYLQGGIQEAKLQYDATELISKHSEPVHILIDYVRRSCFHR